jgi:hypothetical protein
VVAQAWEKERKGERQNSIKMELSLPAMRYLLAPGRTNPFGMSWREREKMGIIDFRIVGEFPLS